MFVLSWYVYLIIFSPCSLPVAVWCDVKLNVYRLGKSVNKRHALVNTRMIYSMPEIFVKKVRPRGANFLIYLTDASLSGKSDIATRRERLRQRRETLLVARSRLREGAANLSVLEGSKSEEQYGLFLFPSNVLQFEI